MAKDVNIKIKVDKKTGAIGATGKEFDKLAGKARKTKGSFLTLGKAVGGLGIAFAALGGIRAIFGFFSNAIKGAEEMAEAMRRLKFAVEATSNSFKDSKKDIVAWIDAIQVNTRFMDTEAAATLEKFIRITGNVNQAMRASQIAMGLNIQSGKRSKKRQVTLQAFRLKSSSMQTS